MREQFHNLQALRGVACLLVFLYHLAQSEAGYGLGFNPLKPFKYFGYAGVDLFFVLSGFIIATTSRPDLGRMDRLPRYLFRRLWRIFPVYWVALIISTFVLTIPMQNPLFIPGWESEFRDSILLAPQPPAPRLLPVAWTLSYELMFYIAFAVLFILPRWTAVPVLIGWGALVIQTHIDGSYPDNRFADLPVNPFVLEFLLGAAVAWCPLRLSGWKVGLLVAVALVWCAAWTGLLSPNPHPHADRLAKSHFLRAVSFGLPGALFVLAATAWERTGGRIRPRWLEPVGDASYSIYLLHIPCMMIVMWITIQLNWKHGKFEHVVWLILMTAGCIVPGMLFHKYVERPLLNLAKTRRPVTPVVVPEAPPIPARRAA